ncbi:ketopantoate reductase family protein [Peribacillus glennii]|uniref:2-dehydropantoate 2-reductase n=1 Tax=Peribacillus glennii TaxID=2303991 RepID=A0A372LAX8_9BACI|nr:2-dehydropantoate 2-reductase [Peribacillus glennii]RFU62895.1 2-dehydropantoate 2-reductase [Peribacillus glennii]
MNIVIMGAGAVGAYFGGRLAETGQNIHFLVREGRARQLNENGLEIKSTHGDYHFDHLNFTADAGDIENPDLVILAVKGYHLNGTIPLLKTLATKGAKVLPLLNGIEHIPILQKELGFDAVIGGSAYIIATLDDKGYVIHSSGQHDIVFGPLHPSQEEICSQLEAISRDAKMKSRLSREILYELWNKYTFITAFSGVTTASGLEIGEILSSPPTAELLDKVLKEMQKLAKSQGVTLSDEEVAHAFTKFGKFPSSATSSMHQDRRKGLTLEVEHLQGGALRLAKQAGISLPVVETLYGLIKPFEK